MSSSIKRTLEWWFDQKKLERRRKLREKVNSDLNLLKEHVGKYEVTNFNIKGHHSVHDMERLFKKMEFNNMWEEVLSYLTDPADIKSAYFTCTTFSKHLKPKLVMMMLPKVFEILRANDYLNFHSSDPKEKKGILAMIQVSKSWRELTDENFLHHSVLKPEWHMSIKKDHEWKWTEAFLISLEFRKVDDINFAMRTLTSKGLTNSTIIRSLEVSYDRFDFVSDLGKVAKLRNFYEKLIQFLEIYGTNIWALHYTTPKDSDMIISVEKNDELMNGVFRLLPNLKALILSTHDWEGCDSDMIRRTTLWRYFYRCPFKNTLHFFSFNSSTVDIPKEPFVAQLLIRCRNLKAVSLGNCFKGSNDEIFLALCGLKLERIDYHSYCPEAMESLKRRRLPLKQIKLSDSKRCDIWINAAELFSVLAVRFDSTLEVLDVETKLRNEGNPFVLRLPWLKTIRIKEIYDGEEWNGNGVEISVTKKGEMFNKNY